MSEHNAPTDPHTPDAVVTDPDEYNRTQRFKEIHQARQRVSKFLSNMDIPRKGGGKYNLHQSTRLGHLVSLYITELEPLIHQSNIDTTEFINDDLHWNSLLTFAADMGIKPGDDEYERTPTPSEAMHFFSAANRFYAHVGMDLELKEEQGDAGFDYSDILEEGPPGGERPQLEADGGGSDA